MLISQVLERLLKFKVKVLSLCKFFERSVQYLGHVIGKQGDYSTDEKLKAIPKALQNNGVNCLKSPLYSVQSNGLGECHLKIVKIALF